VTTEQVQITIEHAAIRAKLLVATAGLPLRDWEDIAQDLRLDFVRRAHRFDDTRGAWDGFVRGLMRNEASVILNRHRRRARHEVIVGDMLDSDPSEDPLERIAVHDIAAQWDTTLEVRRVLSSLPEQLQQVARMLPDSDITEICAATRKSRSRVYQMVRQLRAALVEAGLGPRQAAVRIGRGA